ncbi:MAG: Transcriptional regulator, PadR family, partial [uncultured Acidimicrobiales bacterium]
GGDRARHPRTPQGGCAPRLRAEEAASGRGGRTVGRLVRLPLSGPEPPGAGRCRRRRRRRQRRPGVTRHADDRLVHRRGGCLPRIASRRHPGAPQQEGVRHHQDRGGPPGGAHLGPRRRRAQLPGQARLLPLHRSGDAAAAARASPGHPRPAARRRAAHDGREGRSPRPLRALAPRARHRVDGAGHRLARRAARRGARPARPEPVGCRTTDAGTHDPCTAARATADARTGRAGVPDVPDPPTHPH